MTRDEWVALARQVIVEMIEQEHAVTNREIEARAANSPWPSLGGVRIDPDFLTEARRELEDDGIIHKATAPTRGGRPIGTWSFVNDAGIKTAIQHASGRKRLLTARHYGWSESSTRNPKGLIGQAGEAVVSGLFNSLDPYSHLRRDTAHILNTDIPGGTVDASAFLMIETPTGGPTALTVVAEVKNQRQWFYPKNRQLHRFLAKAAHLQVENPEAPILPVFICSWRHYQTLELARLLGFYAVGYWVQYVLDRAEIEPRHFTEVVNELGYADLRRGTSPNVSLRHALEISLPRDALLVSERWRETAPIVLPHSEAIRDTDPYDDVGRQIHLDALLQEIADLFDEPAT